MPRALLGDKWLQFYCIVIFGTIILVKTEMHLMNWLY